MILPNLAANAKIEDVSRLFRNHVSGSKPLQSLSGVMVSSATLLVPRFLPFFCEFYYVLWMFIRIRHQQWLAHLAEAGRFFRVGGKP